MKISFSNLSIIAIIILICLQHFRYNTWDNQPQADSFHWDNFGYYLYLPAIFENQDLETLENTKKYFEEVKPSYSFYQVKQTELGKPVIVYPMGLAIVYAPPYLVTKAFLELTGKESSSFARPYHFTISMWCLLLVFASLFLLQKILRRYFSDKVTAIAIFAMFMGSNSFFYGAYFPQIVHPVLFFIYLLFIELTIRWHEKQSKILSSALGALYCFSVIIRPSSIFLVSILVLWGVGKEFSVLEKILFWLKRFKHVLLMVLAAILVCIPQLLYWKMQSGNYLYFSYAVDWFDFTDPNIWKGIFGGRTGWAFHHPIILLGLIGLFWSVFKRKQFSIAIFIFSILQIWFILSWSNYWYGGGFGHRGFTEFQGVLAIMFAVFVAQTIQQNKLFKTLGIAIVVVFTLVGLIRIVQYDNFIWGKPNMSSEYAKENYFQINPKAVDYSTLYPASRGDEAFKSRVNGINNVFNSEIIYLQDFEHLKARNIISEGSNKALKMDETLELSKANKFPYNSMNPKPGDGVKISFAFKANSSTKNAFLIFEIMDRKQKTRYHYTAIPIELENSTPSQWSNKAIYKELPDIRFDTDIVSIYVYNPNKSTFFVDNLEIRHYKFAP